MASGNLGNEGVSDEGGIKCKHCGGEVDPRVQNNGLVDYVTCLECGYDWQLWKLRLVRGPFGVAVPRREEAEGYK